MQNLGEDDFSEVKRCGSHVVMQKKLQNTTITAPVPDHGELKIGTQQSIIRQSAVPRADFEE